MTWPLANGYPPIAETTTRVCPACHSQLPVHFGKVRSRLIVLAGAKESGKTVFMTVLVHELMHQLGEQLKAAISGADDSTRHRFASEYEKPLYRESQLLAPTTTAGMRSSIGKRRLASIWFSVVVPSQTCGQGQPEGSMFAMFCGRFVKSCQSSSLHSRIRLNKSARHSGLTWLSNTSAREAQKTRWRRPFLLSKT